MEKYRCWVSPMRKYVNIVCDDFQKKVVYADNGQIYSYKDILIQDRVKDGLYVGDIVTGIKTNSDRMFVICKRTDSEFIGYLPVEVFRYNEENFPSRGVEPIFKGLSAFVAWNDLKVVGNICQNPELLKCRTA